MFETHSPWNYTLKNPQASDVLVCIHLTSVMQIAQNLITKYLNEMNCFPSIVLQDILLLIAKTRFSTEYKRTIHLVQLHKNILHGPFATYVLKIKIQARSNTISKQITFFLSEAMPQELVNDNELKSNISNNTSRCGVHHQSIRGVDLEYPQINLIAI